MKIERELRSFGERHGLKCLGLEDRSKHYKLVFQREDGATYALTLHKSKNEPFGRKVSSMEKQLKRFASGQDIFNVLGN